MTSQARSEEREAHHSTAGVYALQLFLATVGAMLTASLVGVWLYFLIAFPFGWTLSPRAEDCSVVALTILLAAAAGCLISDYLRRRSGTWVWVPLTLWLLLGVVGTLLDPGVRYGVQNGSFAVLGPRPRLGAVLSGLGLRNCSESECLGLLMFTLPFLSSVAYSFGTWLGPRTSAKS